MNDVTIIFSIPDSYYKKLVQLREEMRMNSIEKEEFYRQVFIKGIDTLLKETKQK